MLIAKCKFISIDSKSFAWVNKTRETTFSFNENSFIQAVNFLIDNCYFTMGNQVFCQVIGVAIEYEIFGEGSHISTNQKRERTLFSLLIGSNMRPFPENFVLYWSGPGSLHC